MLIHVNVIIAREENHLDFAHCTHSFLHVFERGLFVENLPYPRERRKVKPCRPLNRTEHISNETRQYSISLL